jgi:hypothetical protein
MLLEKSGVYQQLKIRMLRQECEQALRLLQKIEYPHRSWGNDSVLQETAILENKFPEQILEFYRKGLGSYSVSADRKVYAEKARVALKIRHMLVDVMNQPAKWKNMIQEMKFLNKQRKAFFEEFTRLCRAQRLTRYRSSILRSYKVEIVC